MPIGYNLLARTRLRVHTVIKDSCSLLKLCSLMLLGIKPPSLISCHSVKDHGHNINIERP